MSEPFKSYIKAIGKGHNAGRSLTQDEAFDAMSQIMQGSVGPEQLGAFLMLLRVREETAEELAGFVAAIRLHNNKALSDLKVDLDLGCYAGKRRHLPWFILAVKALAEQGYCIFLHGTSEPESNRLYLKQVFSELNWPIAKTGEEAIAQLNEANYCYMDLADINSPLDHMIQLRSEFSLRSCANTLARMLNPSQAKASFHGVYHREFDGRHIDVAHLLNDKAVACIRGEGGEVEVKPEREFDLHMTIDGKAQTHAMPIYLDQWQVKPRELNVEELKTFWQDKMTHKYADYGLSTVIATMSCYLMLMENLSLEEAEVKSKAIWQQRKRDWK